ncbi:bifunctional nicotinamidase/pyrazinamidase [bacterium]|nr:bifunctional nicotinamidase/pyrazinamidase [bacterium]
MSNRALLLIDIQNDFCPGGNLPVEEGDQVVPVANKLRSRFKIVAATRDWHPANHCSFASTHAGKEIGDTVELENGVKQALWPAHCVQDTPGAEFHPDLDIRPTDLIVDKAADPKVDAYSEFFDEAGQPSTALVDLLRERDVSVLYVCGLATNICVRATTLDALKLGFEVHVVTDGVRGVDLQPGDSERALQEMEKAGAKLETSEQILEHL